MFALFLTLLTTLAFPGAEGYGAYATGGRGGNVYYVTSLEDCSDTDLQEGTLRWALNTGDDTPRTILFKVCGTIYLTSKLKLAHPNVTIAGQTAPGGGICVAGASIYVCRSNIIIRHMRFRAGDIPNVSYAGLDVENAHNVIIDHCSLSWSMEECLTLYDCDSTTVQWSIIAEGLYNSKNMKGARSYATQWGGEHATMHHCLIANCYSRAPRFNGVRSEANIAAGSHDHDAFVDNEFVNNVIFNYAKSSSIYGGENDTTKNHDAEGNPVGYNRIYMINNLYVPGPTTQAVNASDRYFANASSVNGSGQWYLSGNVFDSTSLYVPSKPAWETSWLDSVAQDNWFGFVAKSSYRAFNFASGSCGPDVYDKYVLKTHTLSTTLTTIQSPYECRASILDKAGATLPRRDEEDARVTVNATGRDSLSHFFTGPTKPSYIGIIDSQDDITFSRNDKFLADGVLITSYPFLDAIEGDSLASDTDQDGLPDRYELTIGLNPDDASDGSVIREDGYSNLEHYLNAVSDGSLNKTDYEELPYTSVQPAEPLAIETVTTNSSKDLILRDGTILILHSGRMYDLLGHEVR